MKLLTFNLKYKPPVKNYDRFQDKVFSVHNSAINFFLNLSNLALQCTTAYLSCHRADT